MKRTSADFPQRLIRWINDQRASVWLTTLALIAAAPVGVAAGGGVFLLCSGVLRSLPSVAA